MNHTARIITALFFFLNCSHAISAIGRTPSLQALEGYLTRKIQADDLNIGKKEISGVTDVRRVGFGAGVMALGFNLNSPYCFSYRECLFNPQRPSLSKMVGQALKSCLGMRGIAYAIGSFYLYTGASGVQNRSNFLKFA